MRMRFLQNVYAEDGIEETTISRFFLTSDADFESSRYKMCPPMPITDVFDCGQAVPLPPDCRLRGLTPDEQLLVNGLKTDLVGIVGLKGLHVFEKNSRQWLPCQTHLNVD